MDQVKLFSGGEDAIGDTESAINAWLAENPGIEVVSVHGNMAPQTVLPAAGKTSAISAGGMGGSDTRRFAPSDVLVIVHYRTQTQPT
jgi:hypothetical protein